MCKKHSPEAGTPLCPGVVMAAGDSPLAPGLSSLALGCSLQPLLLSLPPPCIYCWGCSPLLSWGPRWSCQRCVSNRSCVCVCRGSLILLPEVGTGHGLLVVLA